MTENISEALAQADDTATVPFESGDAFAPANPAGVSDLNLHMSDMLADPDPRLDPYAGGGA